MMHSDISARLLTERIIFVMGRKDTGKTSFITALANDFFVRGYSVGIIDADVGQSDIGPPTSVGFGVVQKTLTTLGDAALRALSFVGSTSPRGHLLPLVLETRKMLDCALRAGLQKILIDTTGLVSGHLGRTLKTRKIDALNPDAVICLQYADECEPILQAYRNMRTPLIVRCAPDSHCQAKPLQARQAHRARSFDAYFAAAENIQCSLAEVGLRDSIFFHGNALSDGQIAAFNLALETPLIQWAERAGRELHLLTAQKLTHGQIAALKDICRNLSEISQATRDDFQNLLLGLHDAQGDCLGLGILRDLDVETRRAAILTPVHPEQIAAVTFSRYQKHD